MPIRLCVSPAKQVSRRSHEEVQSPTFSALGSLYIRLIIFGIVVRIFNSLILLHLEFSKQLVYSFKSLLDRTVAALLTYLIYLSL